MKSNQIFRIGSYLLILLIFIMAVQWKKSEVIAERTREAPSLPLEIDKFGSPVDLEEVGAVDFKETLRFTLGQGGSSLGSAHFFLSRAQVNQVQAGQIILNDASNVRIGVVTAVSQRPDLTRGLYRAEVSLDQPKAEAPRAIKVVTRLIKNRISVPLEAIELRDEKNSIWIVKDNKAERVEVQVGSEAGGRIEVLSGLKLGDQIIVNGFKSIRAGAKVRVRNCEGCKGANS